MKILFIGDIVGRPGRGAVRRIVPKLRQEKRIEFVVANAENVAGGSGITPETATELLDSQVDILTSGDHIWKQRDIYAELDSNNRILRPVNYPETCPGRGVTVLKARNGLKVGVINVLGRVFMRNVDACPFKTSEAAILEIGKSANIILVDIHAEATSEKVALGRFLDGRVSAIFGSHTHVQTADEKILPKGSAYISDVGMTGSQDSVIGRKTDLIIEHFLTCMPIKFALADKDVELQGVIVEVDQKTGRAVSIERVREKL